MPVRKKVDITALVSELNTSTRTGLPHLSELAESVLREAGGTEAFAQTLWDEFKKAPQGSLVRAQLFGMIQKVWKYATESMRIDDPEALSDDDLEKEIKRVVLEIMGDAATTETTPDVEDNPRPATLARR